MGSGRDRGFEYARALMTTTATAASSQPPPDGDVVGAVSALLRAHPEACTLSVLSHGGANHLVPVDRAHRYAVARAAGTVAAMSPSRVMALDSDDCVLGALSFDADADADADVDSETNAAIYSRAYRDVARIHQQAMQGASALQAAAIELIRDAGRLRAEAERAALASARREGLLQAEHVRLKAAAKAQRQLAAADDPDPDAGAAGAVAPAEVAAAVAEVLPEQLRPLLMQLLPQLAREFGLVK